MTVASTVLAALALLEPQAADQIVVTAAPSLDAQRLADALRVYLDEFGIRVETRAAGEAGDLRKRIDDARQLGEALRAVAVVRAEHGPRGSIEIELVDLATDKALVVGVPRPERDEDLYRALALKIQAVLRATLSEARGELDPRSSLGRLVAEPSARPPPPETPPHPPQLALDAGYGLVAFPDGGPTFGGLAVRASWRPRRTLELALGTAAMGAVTASNGAVDATAAIVPLHATVRRPFGAGRVQLYLGPCLDATYIHVSTTTATATPVRSTRNVMVGIGAEAEGRVAIVAPAWLFARVAGLGVLNGERYDVAGSPLLDTSRLQLSGTVGAGLGLP